MRRIAVFCAVMLGFSVQMAIADIPGTINFQGRLTDTVGNAVTNGTYGVTFTLHYTAEGNSPTGWSEVQNVTTERGYFNIALGSNNPLSSLNFNYPYYLEIQVAGDAQPMYPRQPLSSVPYAMRAKNAITVDDGAVTSAKILNGTITSADVAGATITGSNIASGTITAGNIANSTITGGKIAGATITNTNIANGAIDTQAKAPWAPVVNGGITNPKIVFGSIGTDVGGSRTVDISAYGFSTVPIILTAPVVSSTGDFGFYVNIYGVTATQFNVQIKKADNSTFSGWFNWVAIGN